MRNRVVLYCILLAALTVLIITGCKSSGMAMTSRGQVMAINIEGGDKALPEGGTDTLHVSVDNKGVAKLGDVEFTVEVPNELTVLNEHHGDGIEVMEMRTSSGTKLYHYMAGNLEARNSAKADFEVKTTFGSLDRTGEIKVTAWQKDLPGNHLVESRRIKLQR